MNKENCQWFTAGFAVATLMVVTMLSVVGVGLMGFVIGQEHPRPEAFRPVLKFGSVEPPSTAVPTGKPKEGLNAPEDLIPPNVSLSLEDEELQEWLTGRFQLVHEKFLDKGMSAITPYERIVWAIYATHAQVHHPEILEAEGESIQKAFKIWTSWSPKVARQLGLPETEELLKLPWQEFRTIQPKVISKVIKELKGASGLKDEKADQVRYEA